MSVHCRHCSDVICLALWERRRENVKRRAVTNHLGSSVESNMWNLTDGPHYEIQSTELADWVERQGIERWWMVGGDPILGGKRAFPAPADLLAVELRKLNRLLLVQAREGDTDA